MGLFSMFWGGSRDADGAAFPAREILQIGARLDDPPGARKAGRLRQLAGVGRRPVGTYSTAKACWNRIFSCR
jgi:hypothetical protein